MLFLAGISVDCPCQKFRTSTYNSCYWNVIYNILLSLVQLTHLYKQLIINLITVFTTTDGILSTECMMRQLFRHSQLSLGNGLLQWRTMQH